jgi:hypothetical protein
VSNNVDVYRVAVDTVYHGTGKRMINDENKRFHKIRAASLPFLITLRAQA